MNKFKITDNATFAFVHTYKNIKDFIKSRKNLAIIFSLLLIITTFIMIKYGNEVYDKGYQELQTNSSIHMVDEYCKGKENLSPEMNTFCEDAYKEVEIEQITYVKKNWKSMLSKNGGDISAIVIFYLITVLTMTILGFEWLRFCLKSKYSPSLFQNIWIILKMFFISFGYVFIPTFVITGLNVILFLISPVIGLISILLWIPLIIYFFMVSPAIALKYVQLIINKNDKSVFNLIKLSKGNILRFFMVSFLIGLVFMIVNYIPSLFSVIPNTYARYTVFILLDFAITLIHILVSYTFFFAFYKTIIKNK